MSSLAQAIVEALQAAPLQFSEIVDQNRDVPWPEFLKAWGEVRSLPTLARDPDGRYIFKVEN